MPQVLDAGSVAREVPGVGRLTVPGDHPEVVEFLYQAVHDAGTINIFSDWLRDRHDDRADLVADLAAPGVVPDYPPGRDEEIPPVAGREWHAVRRSYGVRGRVYPGTRLAAAIRVATGGANAGGWDGPPYPFEHRISPRRQPPARVRSALDCCRGRFPFPLSGTHRLGVIALRSLRTTRGVGKVPLYLPYAVPPAVGARWLREVKVTDPGRFSTILADGLMGYVLEEPGYEGIAPAEQGTARRPPGSWGRRTHRRAARVDRICSGG